MSPGSRPDPGEDGAGGTEPWRPHATLDTLRERAALLVAIRDFFARRGVLEVETPAVLTHPNADPNIEGLTTTVTVAGRVRQCFLRTSPEHGMKRLLAAGTGPIYQIGKVFRDGESGALHNPEFTLLEWYRPGFDHHELMDETEALVRTLHPGFAAVRMSYRSALVRWTAIDPWRTTLGELRAAAGALGASAPDRLDRDACLDLLVTLAVQPGMKRSFPGQGVFLHGYPASQAALARLLPGTPEVAARFELFLDGIELANGYWELTDPREQRRRFEAEQARRRGAGREAPPLDELLLGALEAGLPDCAGVALGVERLHMWLSGKHRIDDVLAFPIRVA